MAPESAGGQYKNLHRAPWTAAAVIAAGLFVLIAVDQFRDSVTSHERIYLIGSRIVADPTLYPGDLTWSKLPPTTFLYDHLVAPLRPFAGDFGIVTIGRLLSWLLTAGALAALSRLLRLPWWSIVAGVAVWLLYGQRIANCGSPIEGFQVKALSYPLVFIGIVLAARGRAAAAGAAMGLATAFHVIVGGWASLALFASMALNRRLFGMRQLVAFLLGSAPFVLPVVIATAVFHEGVPPGVDATRMDAVYVRFAEPHCTDPSFFMTPARWANAAVMFLTTPILIRWWFDGAAARVVNGFLVGLISLFGAGMAAHELGVLSVMKLYPLQLAMGLVPLFFFVFCFAHLRPPRPRPRLASIAWAAALVLVVVELDARDVTARFIQWPGRFVGRLESAIRHGPRPAGDQRLYEWIRTRTPRDAVFVTPLLSEFWSEAERTQVVSFRHPPLDYRILDWERRLIELNGSRPFTKRGFDIRREFDRNEGALSVGELIRIRDRYGATYYLTKRPRRDLAAHLVFSSRGGYVYSLAALS